MRSGKSTLLNALLAASLLPSTNVPETARVVKIVQSAGPPSLTWHDGDEQHSVEGAGRVCAPPTAPRSCCLLVAHVCAARPGRVAGAHSPSPAQPHKPVRPQTTH